MYKEYVELDKNGPRILAEKTLPVVKSFGNKNVCDDDGEVDEWDKNWLIDQEKKAKDEKYSGHPMAYDLSIGEPYSSPSHPIIYGSFTNWNPKKMDTI